MSIKIFPSLLSADFGKLNEEVASIEPFADGLHFDVMDGHFVQNLSFGIPVLKSIVTKLPVEVHLMVENPGERIPEFVKAGVQYISFHVEAVHDCSHMGGEGPEHRPWGHCVDAFWENFKMIQNGGAKAGLAIRPKTDMHKLDEFLEAIDYVIVMGVEPGFGGQPLIESTLEKVRYLKAKKPSLEVCIDGGMNEETAKKAREAGVDNIIAGSYIFGAADRKIAIEKLR